MSAVSATNQRLRLEATASKAIYELLNLPMPASVAAVLNLSAPSPRGGGGAGRRCSAERLAALESALRLFYDKLPYTSTYNHGAQLCIEDVLSYLRKMPRSSPVDGMVDALTQYLGKPSFVGHLAAFGKLPDHPYVLGFDPYAYQSQPPPSEEASRAFDPVAFDELKNGAASGANIMMPSKADLEALSKELDTIFGERLPKSRIVCPKCRESKFMRFHEEQRRSADEGSSYVFNCGNCGHSGRSR
jgi:hypothetical protein